MLASRNGTRCFYGKKCRESMIVEIVSNALLGIYFMDLLHVFGRGNPFVCTLTVQAMGSKTYSRICAFRRSMLSMVVTLPEKAPCLKFTGVQL